MCLSSYINAISPGYIPRNLQESKKVRPARRKDYSGFVSLMQRVTTFGLRSGSLPAFIYSLLLPAMGESEHTV